MNEWHYSINGEKTGPVSAAELKRVAEIGLLTANDLVWKKGLADWVPAAKVKGLIPVSEGPPPLPPRTEKQPTAPPTQNSEIRRLTNLTQDNAIRQQQYLLWGAAAAGLVVYIFAVYLPATNWLGDGKLRALFHFANPWLAVIFMALCGYIAALCLPAVEAPEPDGIEIETISPDRTLEGESVAITIRIKNTREDQPMELQHIDITSGILEHLELRSIQPAPKKSKPIPVLGTLSNEFERQIPQQTSQDFLFTFTAKKKGRCKGAFEIGEGVREATRAITLEIS